MFQIRQQLPRVTFLPISTTESLGTTAHTEFFFLYLIESTKKELPMYTVQCTLFSYILLCYLMHSTRIHCAFFFKFVSQTNNSKTTICPPVAELAPRKFGPLFFGRHSGPNRSDFEQHFLLQQYNIIEKKSSPIYCH